MKSSLENLTVFLTGATGGIGQATAAALAGKGALAEPFPRQERT